MRFITAALGFALSLAPAVAQVTITPNGNATSAGPVIPAATTSAPIVFAPVFHLGVGQTQPVNASGTVLEAAQEQAQMQQQAQGQAGATVEITNPAPMNVQVTPSQTQAGAQPFNFGVAEFSTAAASPTDQRSLGDIARSLKKGNAVNAKTYTNQDIDRINQQFGGSAGVAANNEPANGVITAPADNDGNAAPALGAPAQPQQQNNAPARSPFGPRGNAPAASPTQPDRDNTPRADASQPGASAPVVTAQNNPPANPADENAATTKAELPRAASRLPLMGVLGFMTVVAGIFVRYQRARPRA